MPDEPTNEEMISAVEFHIQEYAPISPGMICPGRRMKDAIIRRIERKVSREWVIEKTRGVSIHIDNVGGTAADPIRINMDGRTWLIAMLEELGWEVEE
jgi:hypothetical protein